MTPSRGHDPLDNESSSLYFAPPMLQNYTFVALRRTAVCLFKAHSCLTLRVLFPYFAASVVNYLFLIRDLQYRVSNATTWHLNIQHGRNSRSDVRHSHKSVGFSGIDMPAHPYQRNMVVIRIPQPMRGASGTPTFPAGLHDDDDVSSPLSVVTIDKSGFYGVRPGCSPQFSGRPGIHYPVMLQ